VPGVGSPAVLYLRYSRTHRNPARGNAKTNDPPTGIELRSAATTPAFMAARNAARRLEAAAGCWIECDASTRATAGTTPAATTIGITEGSGRANRTCGEPQLGQKAELSLTAEWHCWQGCSTIFKNIGLAANQQILSSRAKRHRACRKVERPCVWSGECGTKARSRSRLSCPCRECAHKLTQNRTPCLAA
jgi:hypothetical protein